MLRQNGVLFDAPTSVAVMAADNAPAPLVPGPTRMTQYPGRVLRAGDKDVPQTGGTV